MATVKFVGRWGIMLGLAMIPAWQPAQAQDDDGLIHLEVCNESGRGSTVAVTYQEVGSSVFTTRGWFNVANGECSEIATTDNKYFYFYADATDGSGRWWGSSHTLCVEYPGPFRFDSNGGGDCPSYMEDREFDALSFEGENGGTYTWRLRP